MNESGTPINHLDVRRVSTSAEARFCAHLMATSEPWITLRFTFEEALERVEDKGREVYVAYSGGVPAGFLILVMKGALVGYIQSIAVKEEWRGRGLGAQLIAFAESRVFPVSPNLFLCVSSFNPRARSFYERLGFKMVGKLVDYLVQGHDEILMRKTLGPIRGYQPSD